MAGQQPGTRCLKCGALIPYPLSAPVSGPNPNGYYNATTSAGRFVDRPAQSRRAGHPSPSLPITYP
jgi:tRNA(Ile2) C34 agmatinyltransferase TiaS